MPVRYRNMSFGLILGKMTKSLYFLDSYQISADVFGTEVKL